MFRRLILLSVVVLALSGCTLLSQPTAPNSTNNTSSNPADVSSNDILVDANTSADGLVAYTNKAVGYSVRRPDKWYWRHYTRGEIGDSDPGVDDYFIADPNPLVGLGGEYLGRIVIAVYGRPLSDFADAVRGFSASPVKVDGIEAVRYAGLQNNLVVSNQKVIEYQFAYNDRSLRIVYTMRNSSEEDEVVFEKVVSSFQLKAGE